MSAECCGSPQWYYPVVRQGICPWQRTRNAFLPEQMSRQLPDTRGAEENMKRGANILLVAVASLFFPISFAVTITLVEALKFEVLVALAGEGGRAALYSDYAMAALPLLLAGPVLWPIHFVTLMAIFFWRSQMVGTVGFAWRSAAAGALAALVLFGIGLTGMVLDSRVALYLFAALAGAGATFVVFMAGTKGT
jgi:hypothetical protein